MKNNVIAFKCATRNEEQPQKTNECKTQFLRQEKAINLLLGKNKSLFSKLNRLLLEEYQSQKDIDFYNEGYQSAIAYIKKSLSQPFVYNRIISELFAMYYAYLLSSSDKGRMENSLFFINSQESFYSFCSSFEGKEAMQKRCTQIQLYYNKISFLLGHKNSVLQDYIITHRSIYKIDTEKLFFEGYLGYLNRLFSITLNKLS